MAKAISISASRRKLLSTVLIYLCLTLLAFVTVIPFVWTLSTALKGPNEAIYSFPPRLIPRNLTFSNFRTVWTTLPIPRYFLNSIILAFFDVTLPIVVCSMAGFALARMQFKGKELVFMVIVATMMIPGDVKMIPIYLILTKLGLLGKRAGVILPGAAPAFGIFLMRQAYLGVPKEIEDSAFIDGANVWQIWRHIMLPMIRPSLATLAILQFRASWNAFLWPLLVFTDPNMYPLTVGLYHLRGTFVENTRLIAAGAVVALVPIMIVFIAFQRYFIEGAYSSAVKG
ncbi:MAG TPA: carbohydrate ABC transporter permease [Limnochordia bacterium]|nr:carbohydrate ABC transporter permease [Limnochordia bacterium]HPU66343.1 carbohydrate ABC transporter permease [Limnochordia bacterium]